MDAGATQVGWGISVSRSGSFQVSVINVSIFRLRLTVRIRPTGRWKVIRRFTSTEELLPGDVPRSSLSVLYYYFISPRVFGPSPDSPLLVERAVGVDSRSLVDGYFSGAEGLIGLG